EAASEDGGDGWRCRLTQGLSIRALACRGRFDLYVAPGDATARTGKILSTRKDVPMDADRFDRVSKLFAKPRLSRRAALAASAAGLGSVALRPLTGAQEATPVPSVPT